MTRPHKHIRLRNKAKAEDKQSLIQFNMANPDPVPLMGIRQDGRMQHLGYRLSPSPKQSHQFRPHFTPMGAGSSADSNLTHRQKAAKYREKGPYKESTKVPSGSLEVKIRVGTTPSHYVPIKDKETGEERLVKVGPKAKWGPIGSKPKDGGKEG